MDFQIRRGIYKELTEDELANLRSAYNIPDETSTAQAVESED